MGKRETLGDEVDGNPWSTFHLCGNTGENFGTIQFSDNTMVCDECVPFLNFLVKTVQFYFPLEQLDILSRSVKKQNGTVIFPAFERVKRNTFEGTDIPLSPENFPVG